MKNTFLKSVFSIIVLVLLQENICNAQLNLTGTWMVRCALERSDKTSINFCGICPTKIDSSKSSMTINGLFFNFNKNTLTITKEHEKESVDVKCKIESDEQSIEFKFEGNEYEFTALMVDTENYILKQKKNGSLLLMTKVK